jgi:hypothetical protein
LVVELRTATGSATEVVVGAGNVKSTSTLTSAGASIPLPIPPPMPTQAPPQLSIAGSIYPANSLTQFSLGADQTLTPGGVATLGGTEISLAPSGSIAVVGSSTQILLAPEPTMTTVAGVSGGPGGSSGVGGATPPEESDALLTVNAAGGWRSEMNDGVRLMWLIGFTLATGYFGGVL